TLASQFAAETSLPLRALGIVQDNPSSAEAMEFEERELIELAEFVMGSCFGPRLVRLMQTALQIRDGWDDMPEPATKLGVVWSNPANPPESALADALVKLTTALPWLSQSRLALEMLNWDNAKIERGMADMRKA